MMSKSKPGSKKMFRRSSLGTPRISFAAGPMGTVNVTVTVGGVTAPLGPPATCTVSTVTCALALSGNPISQQEMALSTPGNYTTTFFGLPPGSYKATVCVNWQIVLTEKATVSGTYP
jgi:hypothetical protein